MSKLTTSSSIMSISPYVPGEAKTSSQNPIRLASNENTAGPSPMAIQAYQDAAAHIHRYSDGASTELRQKIAEKYNLNADQIICGTGSDELISLLCTAFAPKGSEVLYSQYGFLMYPIAAKISGATPVTAPEPNRVPDVEQLLQSVTEKTSILFIANPNNPTGAMMTRDEILHLREKLRSNILLVLDGAYTEFVDDKNYTAGDDLIAQYDNIVMLRTFSKLHALSGLRVGWGYAPTYIINILNRIRGVFNVNIAAQKAAVASLADTAFIEKSFQDNLKNRSYTEERLKSFGLTVYPSQTNFLLVSFGTAENADACSEYLKTNNILVRALAAYGLPDCLRITIGTQSEMETVCTAIESFTKQNEAK